MQKIAALSNLVSYYFIGLPVGIALMFATQLRILGNAFIPFNHCIFLPTKMKYCDPVIPVILLSYLINRFSGLDMFTMTAV